MITGDPVFSLRLVKSSACRRWYQADITPLDPTCVSATTYMVPVVPRVPAAASMTGVLRIPTIGEITSQPPPPIQWQPAAFSQVVVGSHPGITGIKLTDFSSAQVLASKAYTVSFMVTT